MSCMMYGDKPIAGLMPDKQVATITGTTDSSGVLTTSYTANDLTITSAICAGNIVLPFVNGSYAWRLKVTDTSGNPKASTSVTVYAYYY